MFRSDQWLQINISENKAVLKQSSSDSKKKDLTIANQMQNGVNSNSRSRERETNNFEDEFPRTSNCAIIFDVLGSYLEEAKPILGGAEIADYVAEVNNFQKVLF